ncbi:hypothetical protein KL86PLE_130024 [uncultured Pleomorphomonas sp.]|uniref:Uncharacterized protein n=1 Tax=uncultured Pleomorphomonas sp. TaxID=442121 RepID=A0A212L8Q2_9HYPH|nr:hypothetical protein KL86PLE_130024 [uncultured Pleomorphomonas sp.]
MLQDKAGEAGDRDRVVDALVLLVGQAKQDERCAIGVAVEMSLHCHDLGRLVFERVEPVLIARQYLQRRDHCHHAHRHDEHRRAALRRASPQQMPGAAGADHQGRGEIGGQHHVNEAIGKGRREDDRPPVERHELAGFVHAETGRRLHPGIGRENPGRRQKRAEGHHAGGKQVQAVADAMEAEQHDAEKARFEEKGRQHLVAHQRADHRPDLVGELAPVGAELVGHDDARHDAHAEGDGEDRLPELEQLLVDLPLGDQPQRVEHEEIARQADGEGRQDDMEGNGEGELQSGEQQGIQVFKHRARSLPCRLVRSIDGRPENAADEKNRPTAARTERFASPSERVSTRATPVTGKGSDSGRQALLRRIYPILLLNRVGWKLLLVLAATEISTQADRPDHHHDNEQQAQGKQQRIGAHLPTPRFRYFRPNPSSNNLFRFVAEK